MLAYVLQLIPQTSEAHLLQCRFRRPVKCLSAAQRFRSEVLRRLKLRPTTKILSPRSDTISFTSCFEIRLCSSYQMPQFWCRRIGILVPIVLTYCCFSQLMVPYPLALCYSWCLPFSSRMFLDTPIATIATYYIQLHDCEKSIIVSST